MQRRRHIANQDGFETMLVEGYDQQGQFRLRIHGLIIAAVLQASQGIASNIGMTASEPQRLPGGSTGVSAR
jgi:hypothetical protein